MSNILSMIASGGVAAPVSAYHKGLDRYNERQQADQLLQQREMVAQAQQQNALLQMEKQRADMQAAQAQADAAKRAQAARVSLWDARAPQGSPGGQAMADAGLLKSALGDIFKGGDDKRYVVDGHLVDPGGNVYYAPAPEPQKPDPGPKVQDIPGLRKEFLSRPSVKKFVDVEASFRGLQSLSEGASPTDQVGMIFGFIKALDPGSVVRESETGMLTGASGAGARLQGLWNQALGRGGLSKPIRDQILKTAERIYLAERDQAARDFGYYSTLAKRRGYDPWEVVGEPFQQLSEAEMVKNMEAEAEKKRKQAESQKKDRDNSRAERIEAIRSGRAGRLGSMADRMRTYE